MKLHGNRVRQIQESESRSHSTCIPAGLPIYI
jgi:hypothetical protein